MRRVFKYQLNLVSEWQTLPLPDNSRLIHFGVDPSGNVCVWAEVFPHLPPTGIDVQIVETGHSTPTGGVHLGSCVQGEFVWHLYSFGAHVKKRINDQD